MGKEDRERSCAISKRRGEAMANARAALDSSIPYVASSLSEWDSSAELVGVNGAMVIDLRTTSVRPMTREDRIRQMVPVLPDFNVPEGCRWRRFLSEAIPDPMVREYLLRLAGYSLTGYAREHVIPFLYGEKRMGKSTFFNAISEAMGDYSTVSLAANYQRGNGIHRTFYAKLADKRGVFLTEIPRGFQLDEGLVKSITGGEKLEANFMRGNPFNFQPKFSLWLLGNNAPTMSERDGGLLARIKVIKFDTKPKVKDVMLPDIFKGEEQKYVIADIVTAAAGYLTSGLGDDPESVKSEGESYASMADTLSMFLNDTVVSAPYDCYVTRAQLFAAYTAWVEDSKQKHPYGKHGFLKAIREGDYYVRGDRLKEVKVGGDMRFPGIELKSAWYQPA